MTNPKRHIAALTRPETNMRFIAISLFTDKEILWEHYCQRRQLKRLASRKGVVEKEANSIIPKWPCTLSPNSTFDEAKKGLDLRVGYFDGTETVSHHYQMSHVVRHI